MGLNTIKGTSNWGGAASDLNNNFATITAEIEKLKAANVKFKGYYTSEATLKAVYSSPAIGDNAWVGATYPGTVYECKTAGTWSNTAKAPSTPSVQLADYATKTLVDVRTTEYNVSVQHPTSGIDSTNKYTLSGAVALVPSPLRTVGLKCSFLGVEGKVETWEYQGGAFTAAGGWAQGGARKVAELGKRIDKYIGEITNGQYVNIAGVISSHYTVGMTGKITMNTNSKYYIEATLWGDGISYISIFDKNEKYLGELSGLKNVRNEYFNSIIDLSKYAYLGQVYCIISTSSTYIADIIVKVITTDMSLKNEVVDLISRSRTIKDHYINPQGVPMRFSSFSYVDFIALSTDSKYHLVCSLRGDNSVSTISFYDATYNLIDKIIGNYDYNGELDLNKYQQYKTILIRLCGSTASIKNLQLSTSTDNNWPSTVDILGGYQTQIDGIFHKQENGNFIKSKILNPFVRECYAIGIDTNAVYKITNIARNDPSYGWQVWINGGKLISAEKEEKSIIYLKNSDETIKVYMFLDWSAIKMVYNGTSLNIELNNELITNLENSPNIKNTLFYGLEVTSTLINGRYVSKSGKFMKHSFTKRTTLAPILTTDSIHIKGHFSGGGVSYISIFTPALKFIKDISGVINDDGIIDKDFTLTEFSDYDYVFICLSTTNTFASTLELKVKTSSLALANESLASLASSLALANESLASLASSLALSKKFIVLTKYLDIAEGFSPYLYFDNFGNIDKGHDMVLDTSNCTWFDRGVIVNSKSKSIGASVYDWSQSLIENKFSTIRSVVRRGGDGSTKNILIMGDSLIAPCSSAKYVYDRLKEDADYTIIDCGTIGESGSHTEGIGGWRWLDFIQEKNGNTKNPFWDSSINGVNFKRYCETNGYSQLDIMLIALGGNDVGHGSTSFTEIKADAIIANAKSFIDTLLSEEYGYPKCKVIVGIPILGAKDFYGEVFYNRNLTMLSWKYIELFDNGAYSPNITCVNQRLFLDRVEAFPYEERPNPLNETVKNKSFTDIYHPSRIYNNIPYGYYQLGVAFYSKIRSVLNGVL